MTNQYKQEVLYKQIPYLFPQICKYIATEECSELIKEICKSLRKKTRRENLVEEIVDVEICIKWLKNIYHVSEQELSKLKDYKENRILERYEKNNFK